MWLLHTTTAPNGPWILFFLDIAWYLLDFIFALFKLTYWFTCLFIRFPICFIFFHIFFSRKEDSFVCNRFRFLGRSKARKQHCIKSVRIRSYSGPHFPAFGLNTEFCISPYSVQMRENADQNNSEYRHFSRSAESSVFHLTLLTMAKQRKTMIQFFKKFKNLSKRKFKIVLRFC